MSNHVNSHTSTEGLMQEFECTYTNGIYYLLARDTTKQGGECAWVNAMYAAQELTPTGETLLNVKQTDDW